MEGPTGEGEGTRADRAPIVILGCSVLPDGQGHLRGPALRRVVAGASTFHARGDVGLVVVSGGRAWDGVVEADALADALRELGVSSGQLVRERCSMNTRDNARYTAALLRRRGEPRVVLVTCAWHMPRARELFELEGLLVREVPVPAPGGRLVQGARAIRERAARWLGRLHP